MFEFEGRAVKEGVYDRFLAVAEDEGWGELISRIINGYCEKSPSGGYHWLYFSEQTASKKLAQRPATEEELAENPTQKFKTLIETKGEGGFGILAPSGGTTHPTGWSWELLSGGFDTITTITLEEREYLFDLARRFDQKETSGRKQRSDRRERRDVGQGNKIRELMERLEIEDIHDLGQRIGARCPQHAHYENNPRHWSIDKSTGLHYCHSCQFGGDLPKLIVALTGKDMLAVLALLREFEIDLQAMQAAMDGDAAPEADDTPPDNVEHYQRQYDGFSTDLPAWYLEEKHFSAASAARYSVRYDEVNEALVFPIFGPEGDLWGFHRKYLDDRQPFTTKGTHKGKTLFGLDHLQGAWIILQESPIDVLVLDTLGYDQAVASFGADVTATQRRLLVEHATYEIVMALDGDDTGRKSTEKNYHLLKAEVPSVVVVSYPQGKKDFGECTPEEVKQALDNAAPLVDAKVAPNYVTMSDVEAEFVDWLWEGYIPKGKVIICDGDPGMGKSTLTTDWAARISTGTPWPDQSPCKTGDVVICSAEDGLADTIRPRLEAAGADLTHVHAIRGYPDSEGGYESLTIPDHIPFIRGVIEATGSVLSILDPLMAFFGGKVNVYNDAEVRRALQPLARLAEELGVTILVIRHFTKAGGDNPVTRGGGSIGIIGAARLGMIVAPHPEDPERRVLAVSKSNLAKIPPALAFRLVSDEENRCARVEWAEEKVDYTANDLLVAMHPRREESSPARDAAGMFLLTILAKGPVLMKELKTAWEGLGLSEATVERAKKTLGVESFKKGNAWWWKLPDPPEPDDGKQP